MSALLQMDRLITRTTPDSRTPWGSEEWVYSLGDEFPSRLGSGAFEGDPSLLVKVLTARERLSLQIHPPLDQGGKTEAWVVLNAAPDAGVWLGFRDGVDATAVREAVSRGSVEPLLRWVPLKAGDVVDIPTGTPHAVGAGLTLLEPQRLGPSGVGVTLRYWDWARLFDGAPREVHLEQALAATRWEQPPPPRAFGVGRSSGSARLTPLVEGDLQVWRLEGTGRVALPPARCVWVARGAVDGLGPGEAGVPGGDVVLDQAVAYLCA